MGGHWSELLVARSNDVFWVWSSLRDTDGDGRRNFSRRFTLSVAEIVALGEAFVGVLLTLFLCGVPRLSTVMWCEASAPTQRWSSFEQQEAEALFFVLVVLLFLPSCCGGFE